MKSSYELAMERLNKQSPRSSHTITEKQKKQIAEVDSIYTAKIAEKELFLKPKIHASKLEGDATAFESLEKQLRDETRALRDQMEGEKEKIRTTTLSH